MIERLVMISVLLGCVASAASPVFLRCDAPGDCAIVPDKEGGKPLTRAALRKVVILNLADVDLDGPGLELLKEASALESLSLLRTTGVGALQRLPVAKLKALSFSQARGLTVASLARLAAAPRLSVLQADDLPFAPLLEAFAAAPRLAELSLDDCVLNDQAMTLVAGLPSLRGLHLEAGNSLGVTDVGLASLAKAKGLRILRLLDRGDHVLSGKGLAALATLPELEQLELQGSTLARLDPALSAAWPKLISLSVWNSELDDEGLRQLAANWPGLKEFHAGSDAITDGGVARAVALLPALQTLWLFTGGDQTLAAVGKLAELDELVVLGGDMTDAGLAALTGPKHLRKLRLESELFTDAAGASLRKLPQLTSLSLKCLKCTDALVDDVVTLRKLKDLNLRAPLSQQKHRWLYEELHLND